MKWKGIRAGACNLNNVVKKSLTKKMTLENTLEEGMRLHGYLGQGMKIYRKREEQGEKPCMGAYLAHLTNSKKE